MSNKEQKVSEFTFWIWDKTFTKIPVMASSAEEAHNIVREYMMARNITGVIHSVITA